MLTTGFQLAAARALIGLDQVKLAELVKLSANTIRSMESAKAGSISGRATNVQAVQRALESLGIEFLNHGEPGVRLRRRRPLVNPEDGTLEGYTLAPEKPDDGNPPGHTTNPDEAHRGRFR